MEGGGGAGSRLVREGPIVNIGTPSFVVAPIARQTGGGSAGGSGGAGAAGAEGRGSLVHHATRGSLSAAGSSPVLVPSAGQQQQQQQQPRAAPLRAPPRSPPSLPAFVGAPKIPETKSSELSPPHSLPMSAASSPGPGQVGVPMGGARPPGEDYSPSASLVRPQLQQAPANPYMVSKPQPGPVYQQMRMPPPAPVITPPGAPLSPFPVPGQPPHAMSPRRREVVKSVDDLAREFMRGSPARCPPTTPPSAVQDLRVLAQGRAWGKVIEGAAHLQAQGLRGEDAAEVRLCRMLALLRLRRYPEVRQDLDRLVTLSQSSGVPVKFAAHLAAVELLSATAGQKAAADSLVRLSSLLDAHIARLCRGESGGDLGWGEGEDGGCGLGSGLHMGLSLSEREAVLWRRHVTSALANNFVSRGKWKPALSLLAKLLTEVQSEPEEVLSQAAAAEAAAELQSRIGRVFLSFGDVRHAKDFFERAAKEEHQLGAGPRSKIDAGILAIAQGNLVEAAGHLEEAATRLRNAPVKRACSAWGQAGGELLSTGVEADPTPWVAAANNLAVTALYACDLPRALSTLEDLVRQNPAASLRDATVFNLCTLYDLSCDAEGATLKKKTLEAVAKQYGLDDISRASFRMDD